MGPIGRDYRHLYLSLHTIFRNEVVRVAEKMTRETTHGHIGRLICPISHPIDSYHFRVTLTVLPIRKRLIVFPRSSKPNGEYNQSRPYIFRTMRYLQHVLPFEHSRSEKYRWNVAKLDRLDESWRSPSLRSARVKVAFARHESSESKPRRYAIPLNNTRENFEPPHQSAAGEIGIRRGGGGRAAWKRLKPFEGERNSVG